VRVYGCDYVPIEADEVELIVWLLPYQEVQKSGDHLRTGPGITLGCAIMSPRTATWTTAVFHAV